MLDRRHWITLSLLTVAGISFAVMQTLVIPALPFFRAEFGASQSDVTWLVTGFFLSSSVLTPLASSGALVLLAAAHDAPWQVLASMGLLGIGVAFALAATGALVIEHSEPRETGVAGGVNLIMRTIGASIGAQVAAAIISTHASESGFTIAFALAAGAAGLALVPAALLGGRGPSRLRRLQPAAAAG